MKIGYARASLDDRSLDSQVFMLKNFGCREVFSDRGIVGREFVRKGLDDALAALSKGDELVVCQLDRLGCSLPKLVELVNHLRQKGVEFASLSEAIDTSGARSELFFRVMGALALVEHNSIGDRTRAGMEAARALGQPLGRRRSLSAAQCEEAQQMLISYSATRVAERFQVHPSTLRRSLRRRV